MNAVDAAQRLVWGHAALTLVVDTAQGAPVSVRAIAAAPADAPLAQTAATAQPLVEILTPGQGRGHVSGRFSETTIGRRLAFTGSEAGRDGVWHTLRIDLRDAVTGLAARVHLRSADGVAAVQARTEIVNEGAEPVLLLGVTSFAAGFHGLSVAGLEVVRGEGEWLGEGRFTRTALREGPAVELDLPAHGPQHGRGRFAAISTGAWSTGGALPTGALLDPASGQAWVWQVEHNGAWRWEVAERLDGAYAAFTGPNDIDHQWSQRLAPGGSFTTVPVSLATSAAGFDGAVAALSAHRRAIRRPHPDTAALALVFNDYMNTLMGDPTTEKLLPLIDAAAEAGAEIFCIDAGWYDDTGDWWDGVGAWEESTTRFPGGLEKVVAHIRERGMRPGLWLEPEVIGVRSPLAGTLPAEAFLQRDGVRVVEHGRYHLDLRHPAAVAHLDATVDRLVERYGVGFFKLDYNIDPGAGTDLAADSVGAGLLEHNRAHLAWLDGVLDRHPDLVLENCGSGAMRMDYALLSRLQLQSTTDQQNFTLYPPIAASAPLSVLPEQAGNWAYPQPEMTPEEAAFCLVTGMPGRMYLSGHLARMTDAQLASVREAVAVHKDVRAELAGSVPVWPLGLPGWSDPWTAVALVAGDTTYLALWHRGGDASVELSFPHLAGRDVVLDTLYPRDLTAYETSFDAGTGLLSVSDPVEAPCTARFLRIRSVAERTQ
ncbi:alpha-galactosidase [Actinocorallia aurea]